MGFKQTAVNVGGIITASTLPAVALALSWHYGFAGIGLLAVVIGIISFILYKHPPQSASPDATEVVTTSGPKPSPLEIFRNRDIWLVTGAGFCLVVVEFSVIAYFVLYVEETLLLTIVNAGFFLAILESGGAFGKPISGLISDRLFHGNRKRVYILMCSLTFATCLIFTFLQQGAPSWIMIPLCFILGFVGIGWGGLHLTLVGEFAGKELAGTVTGASSVFLMVGNIIGPPTFGYIVDTTGSYRIAWMFLTIMAILAVVFLLFVREANRRI